MDFYWCLEAKAFSGSIVEFAFNVSKARGSDCSEIGSFGIVLAKQSVHIFVRTSFLGAIRIREVSFRVETSRQSFMLCKLFTVVRCDCANRWTFHRLQSLCYGLANLRCRLVPYDSHRRQTRSPVGHGHEIAAFPSAFHGVAFPVTAFRPIVGFIRTLRDGSSIPNSTTQIL